MAVTDPRRVTPQAQDALRERGIAMVWSGLTQAAVTHALQVREATVSR